MSATWKQKAWRVLVAKGWTQKRLALEMEVAERTIYALLYDESKRGQPPKGAEKLDALYEECFPNPLPHHLRQVDEQIKRITRLKRTKANPGVMDELAQRIDEGIIGALHLGVKATAGDEERSILSLWKGHIWFAAAWDVYLPDDHELAHVFSDAKKAEFARLAVTEFRAALEHFAYPKASYEKKERYRLFWSTMVANFGVAVFMARGCLQPALSCDNIRSIFEDQSHPVEEAMQYLHDLDPRDPAICYNICCWTSYLRRESTLNWFERLIEADPKFADTTKRHRWMHRPMDQDSDFAYLLKLLAEKSALTAAA